MFVKSTGKIKKRLVKSNALFKSVGNKMLIIMMRASERFKKEMKARVFVINLNDLQRPFRNTSKTPTQCGGKLRNTIVDSIK